MIKEHLRNRSKEAFYDENGPELWDFFKRLFALMNTGGKQGTIKLPEINGGLFAPDPLLDTIAIPNHVFAKAGQGQNEASVESDPDTLLYLCARYNYAGRGDVRESLSLYTLGRIFEQSITELEYRAGEMEGRETFASLNKRKRDGVYYTPEPVVNYLVEQTLGPWFTDARTACGIPASDEVPPAETALAAYQERLKAIRIVDPACGSGAFLISAFRRLLAERISAAGELERARGHEAAKIDDTPIIAEILRDNVYGVDINPASVELAKLALWLHSARAAAPLSSLDHTVRDGNSLVGEDFWAGRTREPALVERINSFDWRAAFPEVWPDGEPGGFDIVLGNPPYVKLQNLKTADPEVAAYLAAARGPDTYQSAQTGNFDLYLLFIEKGLRLLAPGGRMAYIAPSLWAVNQYGEGLRALLRESRQLDRWVDFKAHQVFAEAITYTALQFFTREPQDAVRVAVEPDGAFSDIAWSDPKLAVDYQEFPGDAEWLMATGAERALIDRLARDCLRLDDPSLTSAIYQGLITSADAIYHLERLRPGHYRCTPPAPARKPGNRTKPKRPPAYEVEIEDAIMRPLVSGREAKRYEDPETSTYLLFPYGRDDRGVMRLISANGMAKRFPRAWAHLQRWQTELRGRENGKMDRDTDWWGYVYPKNLGLHDRVKLAIPRIVDHLKSSIDEHGEFYLDNVDVGGIVAAEGVQVEFLAGILNGPVADSIFRAAAKPFRGDYRSANKQFIAPLPVPNASPEAQREVAEGARDLQARWTHRRDLIQDAVARLGALSRQRQPARWLWPTMPDLTVLIEAAPKALRLPSDRRAWAETRLDEEEAARLAALQAALDRGGRREARFAKGELSLHVEGEAVLGGIFLDSGPGELTAAYWRWLLLGAPSQDAERFASELRRPPSGHDTPAARQFVERVDDLATETETIASAEKAMNELLYGLYGLSAEERELVDNDRARRGSHAGPGRIG